jgi:hypothetical protein
LQDFKLQKISHACTIQANWLNLQAFRKLAMAILFIYNQEQRWKKKHKVQKILELKWGPSKNCDNQIGNARTLFP